MKMHNIETRIFVKQFNKDIKMNAFDIFIRLIYAFKLYILTLNHVDIMNCLLNKHMMNIHNLGHNSGML